jgi:hypothetical protein
MYVHTPLMWDFFEDMTDFQETLIRPHAGSVGDMCSTPWRPRCRRRPYREFRERLLFDGELYSTIIAPGRLTDLSEVQH